MQIKLIDYTGKGTENPAREAAKLLIFVKSTRLELDNELLRKLDSTSEMSLIKELAYIARTIPSSWEFVHYSLLIRNVTRAFTHQLVRTRNASYAQQTMRILPQQSFEYLTGPSIENDPEPTTQMVYEDCMEKIQRDYNSLLDAGVEIQDARGILPTNILTNICMSLNLRTAVQMARKRSSGRVQGEYRDFIRKMVEVIQQVHPWTEFFFDRTGAIDELVILLDEKVEKTEDRIKIWKLIDELRK